MPWKESCAVSERMKFVVEALKGHWPIGELCEHFGISRKTGYKYLARYQREGVRGLEDRPRAPHSHPNETPDEVVRELVRVRRRFPSWGSKKIRAWLEQRTDIELPARSTIDETMAATP